MQITKVCNNSTRGQKKLMTRGTETKRGTKTVTVKEHESQKMSV